MQGRQQQTCCNSHRTCMSEPLLQVAEVTQQCSNSCCPACMLQHILLGQHNFAKHQGAAAHSPLGNTDATNQLVNFMLNSRNDPSIKAFQFASTCY